MAKKTKYQVFRGTIATITYVTTTRNAEEMVGILRGRMDALCVPYRIIQTDNEGSRCIYDNLKVYQPIKFSNDIYK